MHIQLKAISSGDEPYDVDFIFENGSLQAHCTCKAGLMHTACKHRLGFLNGAPSLLADPNQAQQLATVAQWAEQAGFPAMLQGLDEAENQVATAQMNVKRLRKQLGEAMTHGFRPESSK